MCILVQAWQRRTQALQSDTFHSAPALALSSWVTLGKSLPFCALIQPPSN